MCLKVSAKLLQSLDEVHIELDATMKAIRKDFADLLEGTKDDDANNRFGRDQGPVFDERKDLSGRHEALLWTMPRTCVDETKDPFSMRGKTYLDDMKHFFGRCR